MTKGELLGRISSAELTEWMGLQALRNKEHKEAQQKAGPKVRGVRQPRARRR